MRYVILLALLLAVGSAPAGLSLLSASSQRVNLGSVPVNTTGDFTVSIWVRPTSPGANQTILAEQTADTSERLLLGYSASNTVRFYMAGSSGDANIATTVGIANNTWMHLVVTRSGTTNTIYTNGVYRNSGSMSNPVAATAATVGAYTTGIYHVNGRMYDLRCYNRALGDGEIAALYAGRGAGGPVGGLTLWMPMLGTSGAVVTGLADIGPSGIATTPVNSPTYEATPQRATIPTRRQ